MTDWITDERPENTRRFGDITLVSQTHKQDRNTAHLITFGDGCQIRVLPDGATSGQKRSRVLRRVLEAAKALDGTSSDLVETYVIGGLAREGLTWEQVSNIREVTIEEWLAEWLEAGGSASQLLEELADDGWKIVRAE